MVNINLMFRGFSAISDNKMVLSPLFALTIELNNFLCSQEISTIITFREEWYDDRLVFDDMQGKKRSPLFPFRSPHLALLKSVTYSSSETLARMLRVDGEVG